MKRRYIAILIVVIPVIILSVVNYFYPVTYDILFGYMIAVAIMFKGALVSFYSASKLKIIAFIKSLTILQAIFLLVKRWLLDNVLSRWIKKHITEHIVDSFSNTYRYFKSLNIRKKIKNFFLPLLVIISSIWLIYYSGYLDNILLFTELKVFIIGISKTILLVLSKIFSLLVNSWLTPILEVFALSFLLTKLENWLGKDNPIIKAINWLGEKLNRVFSFFIVLNRKYLDPILNKRVSKKSKEISAKINNYINRKKTEYEYEQFEELENKILKGHIDAYFTFKGIEKIKDKKKLYSLINKKTKDYLTIVAYVSRNEKGELVPEDVEDSYYHDIFILEGVATCHKDGVKTVSKDSLDYTDFWILNTSNYPVKLLGSDKFKEQLIEPNSVTFIKTSSEIDYHKDKICFEFNGKIECAIVLDDKK